MTFAKILVILFICNNVIVSAFWGHTDTGSLRLRERLVSSLRLLSSLENDKKSADDLVPKGFLCSENWASCYSYPWKQLDFAEAQQYCKGFNSMLATIDSEKKNEEIIDFLKEVQGWDWEAKWIGGTDENLDGKWNWIKSSGNKPFTFKNWGYNQPDNRNGDDTNLIMLVYKDGTSEWYDWPSSKKQYFICEF